MHPRNVLRTLPTCWRAPACKVPVSTYLSNGCVRRWKPVRLDAAILVGPDVLGRTDATSNRDAPVGVNCAHDATGPSKIAAKASATTTVAVLFACSVRCRWRHAVDHQHFNRAPRRFELQAELF